MEKYVVGFGGLFWGIVLFFLVSAIGDGPLHLDIARVSIVGMFVLVMVINKWPHKITNKLFVSLEILLLSTIMGAGIIMKDTMIIMFALAIFFLFSLVTLIIKLERSANKQSSTV